MVKVNQLIAGTYKFVYYTGKRVSDKLYCEMFDEVAKFWYCSGEKVHDHLRQPSEVYCSCSAVSALLHLQSNVSNPRRCYTAAHC